MGIVWQNNAREVGKGSLSQRSVQENVPKAGRVTLGSEGARSLLQFRSGRIKRKRRRVTLSKTAPARLDKLGK